MKEKKYRAINLRVSDDFHKKIKIEAVSRGITMSAFIVECLEKFFQDHPLSSFREVEKKC